MIKISNLKIHDPSGMHKIYDQWPEFAKQAYESKFEPITFDEIDHIVFAGMGGSGTIGDVFAAILSKTNIHVSIVKGYLLPKTVDKNTLVVITSVSGNTSETITILNSVVNLDCKIIVFSSGGKIESFCKNNKIPFRFIQKRHSPRASFVDYVYSILNILQNIIPINQKDVFQSIIELKKLSEKISSNNLNDTNPALHLAENITSTPLIYYPWGLQAAAIRFKNSLQENAKMHVMIEDVIEASHNSVVSWQLPSNVLPILLQGDDDYVKTKERWNIMKEYFDENSINFSEILSIKGNILSKLICLIYLLDYTTLYRAVLSQVDPAPIPAINFIKNRLNS
jgi:glucose/mannose-6-phosphate isomerase